MNIYLLVLRLVHVSAGIFWVGGALLMNFFIGPSIGATAQAGQQFAGYLMTKTRLVTVMTAAAILTVLAGALLYWRDSQGLTSAWMQASPGIGYAIGGFAGLLSFIFGIMFGQLNKKIALLGGQIKGQPTQEQLAQLQDLRKRITRITPLHSASMIVTVILMATARYFTF